MWKRIKSRFKRKPEAKRPIPPPLAPTPPPVKGEATGFFEIVRDQFDEAIDTTRKSADAARRITNIIGPPPSNPKKSH